jgi:hypothetical protein
MKKLFAVSFVCFSMIACCAQVIEADFKVVSIDSIDHYYMINVLDTHGGQKLILSLKEPEKKIDCNCKFEDIKLGASYHLKLVEQLYILANKEDSIYIDLLEMDYYNGEDIVAGKYKIPYCTTSFFKLLYCSNSKQGKSVE